MAFSKTALIEIIKEKPHLHQYCREMISFINDNDNDFIGPIISYNEVENKFTHITWVCPNGDAQSIIYEESNKRRHLVDCTVGYQIILSEERLTKPLLQIVEENISYSLNDDDIEMEHPIYNSAMMNLQGKI